MDKATPTPSPASESLVALIGSFADCYAARDGRPADLLAELRAAGAADVEPVAYMFEFTDKRIAPKFDSAPHGGNWQPLCLASTVAALKSRADALAARVAELEKDAADFQMAYRIKCDEETKTQAVEIERLRAALAKE